MKPFPDAPDGELELKCRHNWHPYVYKLGVFIGHSTNQTLTLKSFICSECFETKEI